MPSMSAMSFVHEHMHEGAQQQDGQWPPAECSSKVGAMPDAKIDAGERKETPEDPTSGPRRGWRAGAWPGNSCMRRPTRRRAVDMTHLPLSVEAQASRYVTGSPPVGNGNTRL